MDFFTSMFYIWWLLVNALYRYAEYDFFSQEAIRAKATASGNSLPKPDQDTYQRSSSDYIILNDDTENLYELYARRSKESQELHVGDPFWGKAPSISISSMIPHFLL